MLLLGPFKQIITLSHLPIKGTIKEEQLEINHSENSIYIENGCIEDIGDISILERKYPNAKRYIPINNEVLLPSFIDSHTHISFGGSRAKDFSMRLDGKTYLEIAEKGGGIWSTVTETRKLTLNEIVEFTATRANQLLENGITTIEVKSGYGLNVEEELKILKAIKLAQNKTKAHLIPTFLGAHMKPKDFKGSNIEYLELLVKEVFPILREENLCQRIDIFIEKSAFTIDEAKYYLKKAKEYAFEITVHADQFTAGSAEIAVAFNALSADHLESSDEKAINALANSQTVATVLPGASIGLGMNYAPARKLLDAGACVSIASDWNPGSAPMGNLLVQASILATFEKLSMPEIFAGITFRAAKALGLNHVGSIQKKYKADLVSFPVNDYREIIYQQGQIKPLHLWKNGEEVF